MAGAKKKWMVWAAAAAGLAAIAVIIVVMVMANTGSKAVMTIDGEAVTGQELQFYVNRSRALVADSFYKQYQAEVTEGFWETDFSGQTPGQKLLEEAVSSLRYHRAVFTDCRERGLMDDVSFDAMMTNMAKENARRKTAVEQGEVVYGNEQYTQDTYFDYVLSNLQIRQKEALSAEGILEGDDMKLIPFYKEIRDDYAFFKTEDGTLDYGQARARVAQLYRQKAYDDYIAARVEKQEIHMDEKQLAKLVTLQ